MAEMKFSPGRVVATPGALEVLEEAGVLPIKLLARHVCGDWGEVDEHDAQANEQALIHGTRILSSYRLTTGQKVWLLTEADRSATTLLLPDEY